MYTHYELHNGSSVAIVLLWETIVLFFALFTKHKDEECWLRAMTSGKS